MTSFPVVPKAGSLCPLSFFHFHSPLACRGFLRSLGNDRLLSFFQSTHLHPLPLVPPTVVYMTIPSFFDSLFSTTPFVFNPSLRGVAGEDVPSEYPSALASCDLFCSAFHSSPQNFCLHTTHTILLLHDRVSPPSLLGAHRKSDPLANTPPGFSFSSFRLSCMISDSAPTSRQYHSTSLPCLLLFLLLSLGIYTACENRRCFLL